MSKSILDFSYVISKLCLLDESSYWILCLYFHICSWSLSQLLRVIFPLVKFIILYKYSLKIQCTLKYECHSSNLTNWRNRVYENSIWDQYMRTTTNSQFKHILFFELLYFNYDTLMENKLQNPNFNIYVHNCYCYKVEIIL